MIAAIISTAFLVMTAMFAIQEVGVLHDFFMPMDIAFIDNNHGSDEWFQVRINDGDYLIFSSVFYKKEVINDINNPYDITIRILDENQTIVLKDTTIKLGESINLQDVYKRQVFAYSMYIVSSGVFFCIFLFHLLVLRNLYINRIFVCFVTLSL